MSLAATPSASMAAMALARSVESWERATSAVFAREATPIVTIAISGTTMTVPSPLTTSVGAGGASSASAGRVKKRAAANRASVGFTGGFSCSVSLGAEPCQPIAAALRRLAFARPPLILMWKGRTSVSFEIQCT